MCGKIHPHSAVGTDLGKPHHRGARVWGRSPVGVTRSGALQHHLAGTEPSAMWYSNGSGAIRPRGSPRAVIRSIASEDPGRPIGCHIL